MDVIDYLQIILFCYLSIDGLMATNNMFFALDQDVLFNCSGRRFVRGKVVTIKKNTENS